MYAKQQSSTDLHAIAHNSGKLNAATKLCASQYRAHFTLPTGTINNSCTECPLFSDTAT